MTSLMPRTRGTSPCASWERECRVPALVCVCLCCACSPPCCGPTLLPACSCACSCARPFPRTFARSLSHPKPPARAPFEQVLPLFWIRSNRSGFARNGQRGRGCRRFTTVRTCAFVSSACSVSPSRKHASTHACMHACTLARSLARTHAHTRIHTTHSPTHTHAHTHTCEHAHR